MDTCILETGNHLEFLSKKLSKSSHAHKNCWKNFKSKQYSASDIKLLLSGDIEMNPGPAENVINKSICFSPQDNSILLRTRLHRHGLRLDVGGGGDTPVDHFTVVCLVTWPLNESEAGVNLVLIETSMLFICKFLLISMRTASLT